MTQPAVAYRWLKKTVYACCVIVAALPAAMCWLERRLAPRAEGVYLFWAHVMALAPGRPGICLRQAFYRMTLEACASDFYIGFGALFTHREATVEPGAYLGAYALAGRVALRTGCLVGSRVSLLSGGSLHALDEQGRWLPSDFSRAIQIEIGEYAWIGEGAIIVASVGAGAMVAAGTVVSTPVPAHVQVAGNPARFVRSLMPDRTSSRQTHDTRALALH